MTLSAACVPTASVDPRDETLMGRRQGMNLINNSPHELRRTGVRVELGLPNISTLGSQRKIYWLDGAAAILGIKLNLCSAIAVIVLRP